MSDARLGKFLAEVANWRWDEFIKAESDNQYTSNQAMIFALVRSCAMQKLEAIKMSLNRLDGKLKTPVRVEYPKIFYQFPNAAIEAGTEPAPLLLDAPEEVLTGELMVVQPLDLPSMSLRDTVTEMANLPRELPQSIVELASQTEDYMRRGGPRPDEIPMVKSVVAAHLLILAQARNIDALSEVFDQIDGKLAETIQILGDNIYITSYVSQAPPGAYLNKDGVVEIEAKVAQDLWANKLGREMQR